MPEIHGLRQLAVFVRFTAFVALTLLVLIGIVACIPEPTGPIPDPTYVRFVAVTPDASDRLSEGAFVNASAQLFADHKYNRADLALYVQTEPGKIVTEPVFKAIPAGPGQYTLEQSFTVPAAASKVYLIAALYRQGAEESNVTAVTAWDVSR